jgi:hypothetical protein
MKISSKIVVLITIFTKLFSYSITAGGDVFIAAYYSNGFWDGSSSNNLSTLTFSCSGPYVIRATAVPKTPSDNFYNISFFIYNQNQFGNYNSHLLIFDGEQRNPIILEDRNAVIVAGKTNLYYFQFNTMRQDLSGIFVPKSAIVYFTIQAA